MATKKETIQLLFQGIDQVSPVATGIASSIGKVGAAGAALAAPMSVAVQAVEQLADALVQFATEIGAQAFEATRGYETALIDVAKQMDLTAEQARELTPAFEQLGSETNRSATEAASATAEFAKAGIDVANSQNLIATALKFVTAAEVEQATALETSIRLMNGFQISADETAAALNTLNSVADASGTNAQELADGIARVAPVAKNAGLSVEETAAAVATLNEVFGTGAVSGTALNSILLQLVGDTDRVQGALGRLGIAQSDANGELRQASDIIADLATVWPELTDAQKTFEAQQLAGIDQSAKLTTLLDNQSRSVEILGKAQGNLNSIQAEYDKVAATTEQQLKALDNAYQGLLRTIGEQYAEEVDNVIESLTRLAGAAREGVNEGALDGLFDAVNENIAAFAQLVDAIAVNLPEALANVDTSGLEDAFSGLTDLVADFFDADLTTTEGLTDALQKIVDALELLANAARGFTESRLQVAEWALDAAAAFSDLPQAIQRAIGVFGVFANTAQGVLNAVTPLAIALLAINSSGVKAGAAIGTLLVPFSKLAGVAGALVSPLIAIPGAVAAVASGLSIALKEVTEGYLAIEAAGKDAEESTSILNLSADAQVALLRKLNPELAAIEDRLAGLAGGYIDAGEGADEYDRQLLAVANNSDYLEETNRRLQESYARIGATYDESTGKITRMGDEQKRLTEQTGEFVRVGKDLYLALSKSGDELVGWSDNARDVNEITDANKDALAALAKEFNVFGESAETTSEQLAETVKLTDLAAVSFNDLSEELKKIALEGRIKLDLAQIEADVKRFETQMEAATAVRTAEIDLEVTNLEETTQRIERIFDSLDAGIDQSFGVFDKILDQLGEMGDESVDTKDKFSELQDLADVVTHFLESQLDAQIQLTQAQIDLMRAQAERLRSGEATITVEADGLQPHLEAFMWEILSAIQIRTNNEGLPVLLGL